MLHWQNVGESLPVCTKGNSVLELHGKVREEETDLLSRNAKVGASQLTFRQLDTHKRQRKVCEPLHIAMMDNKGSQ